MLQKENRLNIDCEIDIYYTRSINKGSDVYLAHLVVLVCFVIPIGFLKAWSEALNKSISRKDVLR